MKTSAGSLKRVLNLRTCSRVSLRWPVRNIDTALSDPNCGIKIALHELLLLDKQPHHGNGIGGRDAIVSSFVVFHQQGQQFNGFCFKG